MALLQGLLAIGSQLTSRSDSSIQLQLAGKGEEEGEESWSVLRVNAFSSDRKRMGIVVKNDGTGQIVLFMKVCKWDYENLRNTVSQIGC